MKQTLTIILFVLLISSAIDAQDVKKQNAKGKIGLTFSTFGDIDMVQDEGYVGGPSFTGDNFFAVGVNYIKPIYKFLEFETGIEFSNYKFTVHPAPFVESGPKPTSFSLVSIPIAARLNFLKFFFINGGFFLDIEGKTSALMDSQAGIGTNLGLGIKYDFKSGLSAFINPYFKAHSLAAFNPDDNRQKLWESGFRFGLTYQLK
jgi:hypothetical protein